MKDLREVLKTRPVFGIGLNTMSTEIAELCGSYGLDFLYLDAEHTPYEVSGLKNVVMAAECANIAPIIRTDSISEVQVRKALELGAAGVICPHVKTKSDVEVMISGAKFPPLGHRGYDGCVRASHYGGFGYDSDKYMKESHKNQWIIPMCEDFEFIDNIDDILSVKGIDAVCFGPADYAMSLNITKLYNLNHPEVQRALKILIEKTRSKGIEVMLVANPPLVETVDAIVDMGIRMVQVASDLINLQMRLAEMKKTIFDRYI